jgi:hypothetical protein
MGIRKHLALAAACCGTFFMIVGFVIAGSGAQTAGAATTAQASSAGRGSQAVSPRQLAEANAAVILAAFRSPPGAARSGRIAVSWLDQSPAMPTGNLVTKTAWWRAPGDPQAVLHWVQAHLPSRFTLQGSGTVGQASVLHLWFDQFALRPVSNVLPDRWLLVSVASDGLDITAVRVDAEVTWMSPKPATERIPAAAKVVTITPVTGVKPVPSTDRPVTVTGKEVTSIAKAVDDLPLFPPGIFHCPADFGRGIELTFRATPSGPVLAMVTADYSGCGLVQVAVNGQLKPELWHGASLEQQVFKIAHITWKGFPGPA